MERIFNYFVLVAVTAVTFWVGYIVGSHGHRPTVWVIDGQPMLHDWRPSDFLNSKRLIDSTTNEWDLVFIPHVYARPWGAKWSASDIYTNSKGRLVLPDRSTNHFDLTN